jgi:hypothetical protein
VTPDSEAERRALQAWSTFPVDADPRPLVLAGPTVHVRGGYTSGEAKRAAFTGRPAPDPGVLLPAEVVAAVTPHAAAPPGEAGVLRITGATLGEAEFMTDRGPRAFAAWFLEFADMYGPTIVLDPAVAAGAWPTAAPAGGSPMTSAVLEADGRTLTFSFVGSPARYTDYPEALVHESATAVVVVPVSADKPNADGIRLLYAETRSVRAVLAAPLGARVLADWQEGRAVPVTGVSSAG